MKSKILNPKRMKQLIDFKGLELDNGIYPTDIDGLIEYHDSEYILLEVKHKDARVPYGQRLAIQRMVDDFTKAGKKAVAIVCEHKVDDTDKSPGYKFAEAEMRGYPVRIEIGPKDLEAGKCVLCRRDTREKIEVSLDEVEDKIGSLLETIHHDMYERAKAHRDSHTYVAKNMAEFEQLFTEKSGFVKAMWCGDRACEDQIKEKLSVTSRCMPFEQEHIADTCPVCGKPANKMVVWGIAY